MERFPVQEVKDVLSSSSLTFYHFAKSVAREKEPSFFKCLSLLLVVVVLSFDPILSPYSISEQAGQVFSCKD